MLEILRSSLENDIPRIQLILRLYCRQSKDFKFLFFNEYEESWLRKHSFVGLHHCAVGCLFVIERGSCSLTINYMLTEPWNK